jgi:tungstate transport system ATP-binding protein
MVFQRPVMLRRTALGNVRYALKRRLGPAGGTRQEALGILEAFGLSGRAGTAARLLSGGEQQRLALARAWALRPELLLLDEPCAALDPAATRAVELAIAEFAVAGSKIVLTTHDLGQARRLGNDVLFLAHGRLVERGPAEAFFSQPQSEAARRFLAGELLAVETGDASC